jgi:DNA-binding NarL/FixJ family response regulator
MAAKKNNKLTKSAYRVALIDDHPMVRERLSQLLRTQPDFVTCGEADSLVSAMELVEREKPDVAIVDISLKNSSGLDLIKELTHRHPDVRILVLSMYEESLYAERTLRAGARGYITKQEATEQIIAAIRAILRGQIYLNARMSNSLLHKFVDGKHAGIDELISRLTDRELQVFNLVAQGLNNRTIAGQMGIDHRTVETYRARIKEKLALNNSRELLQYAIEWRLKGSSPQAGYFTRL